MVIGGLLLATALFLTCFNFYEEEKAYESSQKSLVNIQNSIKGNKCIEKTELETYDEETDAMRTVKIDGNDYIGYLSIPSLNRTLPILSEYNERTLQMAPCRQFGSVQNDDMVIAGHNYRTHFGGLFRLKNYDKIIFVNMDGEKTEYQVGIVDEIDPDSIDLVENSDWDLVLYTCTYGGKKRIMVGAFRIQ